jgi:DnaJ like chaperone protein
MQWWGKLLGFILGYLIAGFWGALLGCWVGHQFDLGLARSGLGNNYIRNHDAQLKQIWFEATFLVMGCLAKADGRVSEQAIFQAHQVMLQMGLNKPKKQRAIQLFKQGKAVDFNLDKLLAKLIHICQGHPLLLQQFLELQLRVIYNSDGSLSPTKQKLLQKIASHLGFMVFTHYGQSSHDTRGDYKHRENELSAAYAALGVSTKASDQEVKTAYRRLMSRYHPDKIASRGEMTLLRTATIKTQQIKDAYEQIKKARLNS